MAINGYKCALNYVDKCWAAVQSFDTFSCFLLKSVIFQKNRLARLVSGHKFVAEKPIYERS